MIAKLRDAKRELNQLVRRAAEGEDIIITVRGKPMALLSSLKSNSPTTRGYAALTDELARMADSVRLGKVSNTPQSAWDEMRDERV